MADDFDDDFFEEDFLDDFFLEDFFFDFFFLVFFSVAGAAGLASVVDGSAFAAGFDSVSIFGAGFAAALGAGLAAGLRAPGVRNFGDEIDPGGGAP